MKIDENKKSEYLNRISNLITEAEQLLSPFGACSIENVNDDKQRIVTTAMVLAEKILMRKAPEYYTGTIKKLVAAKTAERSLEIACGILRYLQEETKCGRLDSEFAVYSSEEKSKLMSIML